MLPWIHRLYLWGLHGIFVEVVFEGTCQFLLSGNWNLKGGSSIWSFLVYGLGIFILSETAHNRMIFLRFRIISRCLFHALIGLLCGTVFHLLGPRPWDYSHFTSVKGFTTVCLAWLFAGIYFEGIMAVMKRVEPIPRWRQSGGVKIEEEKGRITVHCANTDSIPQCHVNNSTCTIMY